MKHYISILFISLFLVPNIQLSAQNQGNRNQKENRRKNHFEWFVAERQKFLTKETGMTENEAKQFFPLYNEMQEKKFSLNMEVHKEIRQLKNKESVSESDYARLVNALDEIPVKEAKLTKEYSEKFKKILSAEKLFKFKLAEGRFTREVLNKPPQNNMPPKDQSDNQKESPNKRPNIRQSASDHK